ncbi:MAG: carboxylating nicotinate-nucleotide diphosphorylase [Thermodesulfobacteriota bacterium]
MKKTPSYETLECPPVSQVSEIIRLALAEDLGPGDLTTDLLIDPEKAGRAEIVAGQRLVVAGLWVAKEVFRCLDPGIRFFPQFDEGEEVLPGDVLARVEGRLRPLLTGERTALNFLMRLCGVATHVRDFLAQAASPGLRIVDTRKTTPGLRVLEKYAVRTGGGANHRIGLFDGILIKDNHIASCGSISEAIRRARNSIHHLLKVEVEVTTLLELEEALIAGADVVMLDNMDDAKMIKAVAMTNGRALLEASGGMTAERVRDLARSGINIVSVGALTHGAKCVDISMDIMAA